MKSKYGIFLFALFAVCCGLLAFRSLTGDSVDMGPLEEDEKISIDFPDNIAGFATTDLFGNEVTSAVFAEKDVTLVNIWGTFCDPCIEELPDLQELSESMPENAQLIGIVGDVKSARNDEYVEALSLVGKNGITYTNLLADRSMKFMDKVMFVPTTVLVDSEGNVIGEPIIGSEVDEYKKALADYLNK